MTQFKITKQVIKKEKRDRCHSTLDQLRNNLSEKSKRLLDVSIEKGVSNWLTVLTISDFWVRAIEATFLGCNSLTIWMEYCKFTINMALW